MVRVRIAPSPTGFFHVGNARTALFNYLFARKHGGKFVLRLEDTDAKRSTKPYAEDIYESLGWLGMEWDEEYRQSERSEIYRRYLETLLGNGRAFYCFHSETELAAEKEKLLAAKLPPLHRCEYRGMAREEAELLKEAKPEYFLRFKTPAGRRIGFEDLIRGAVGFDSELLGDFSIARDAGSVLYNFAAAVDDHEMQISHVIRGEDHLANTPKQLSILEALGFPAPRYAHLPIILGPDRSKLSKRHAATSVKEYREAGYLPEALVNFMALLGWNPGDNREIFSRAELVQEFSLERVQKSGAVFDAQKLDWMNGEYIRKLTPSELYERAKSFLPKHRKPKAYAVKMLALEQPRLKKLSELKERVDYFFRKPEYDKDLLRWKDMNDDEIRSSLEESLRILRENRKASGALLEKIFFERIGVGDKGRLLWPLRAALSGKRASPGPFEIIDVLGVTEAIRRLETALARPP